MPNLHVFHGSCSSWHHPTITPTVSRSPQADAGFLRHLQRRLLQTNLKPGSPDITPRQVYNDSKSVVGPPEGSPPFGNKRSVDVGTQNSQTKIWRMM